MPNRLIPLIAGWLVLAAAAAAAGSVSPAEALLRAKVEQVMAFAQRPGTTYVEALAFVEKEIAPIVDFRHVAQGVAGPINRRLSVVERQRFVTALRQHILNVLARGLAGYDGGEVRYLPSRGEPADGEVLLGLDVAGPAGVPIRLHVRMRTGSPDWQVTDVTANGISAVAFYRTAFRGLVDRYGFDGALARLQ